MEPSVGTVVHYVPDGGQACRAAVVSQVGDDTRVGLVVLDPESVFYRPLADGGSEYDGKRVPGTWHWLAGCKSKSKSTSA